MTQSNFVLAKYALPSLTSLCLAVFLTLPSHGSALADDQDEANRLFVEAVQLTQAGDESTHLGARAEVFEEALNRLKRIVADHPGSDLAVTLISGEAAGPLSIALLEAKVAAAQALAMNADGQAMAASESQSENDLIAMLREENKALRQEIDTRKKQIANLKAGQSSLQEQLAAAATASAATAAVTTSSDGASAEEVARLEGQNSYLRAETTRLRDWLDAEIADNASLRGELAAASGITATGVAAAGPTPSVSQTTETQNAESQSTEAQTTETASAETETSEAQSSETQASETETSEPAPLTSDDLTGAIREALAIGTKRVVDQVGQVDGFNADPAIHIPLPDDLQKMQEALGTIGLASLGDDMELKLNRAAEEATPEATVLFWNAIADLSLEDIDAIFNGPDDAATQYFRGAMDSPLKDAMRPIVESKLNEVGALASYDSMTEKYKAIPFMPDLKADLTQHVLDKSMDGLFHYLAQEEAAIRNDAVARTTALLERAFGSGL